MKRQGRAFQTEETACAKALCREGGGQIEEAAREDSADMEFER